MARKGVGDSAGVQTLRDRVLDDELHYLTLLCQIGREITALPRTATSAVHYLTVPESDPRERPLIPALAPIGEVPVFPEDCLHAIRRALLRGAPPRDVILVVGSAAGPVAAFLLEDLERPKVVLVDFPRSALDRAVQYVRGFPGRWLGFADDLASPDWNQALLPGRSFDAVVITFFGHRHPTERVCELYEEIFRRLTPSGKFLILDRITPLSQGDSPEPDDAGTLSPPPRTQLPLDIQQQWDLLSAAGFAPALPQTFGHLAIIEATKPDV